MGYDREVVEGIEGNGADLCGTMLVRAMFHELDVRQYADKSSPSITLSVDDATGLAGFIEHALAQLPPRALNGVRDF